MSDKDKQKIVDIKSKKKKGKNQTLDVQDGKLGGKGIFGGK